MYLKIFFLLNNFNKRKKNSQKFNTFRQNFQNELFILFYEINICMYFILTIFLNNV